ncbi:hypothetical protein ET495_15430 [Xylanimonas allomyrinae]|uniref:Lipoprotein n=1 Tax=Xylanimonas allomyrinae TaxID=2509459 RepID=A0A4P6ES73_9MICO|nr:hypothetical protein [Xylanimonas allomyrinae]QAY64369.1 hypothetical protein ET495_15430 [Xylanimonas allomyrinae]
MAALAVASGLVLSGCIGGGGKGGASPQPIQSASAGSEGEKPAAKGSTGSRERLGDIEQTIGTPGGGNEGDGTVTVAIRAVEVTGPTMTVRWALRWDEDASPAKSTVTYGTMGIEPIMTVTDGANVKAYRPICLEGSWKSDPEADQDPVADCVASQLASPTGYYFEFPNHGVIEAWAVLPAPEGRPEKVDVLLAEGLPAFTGVDVTYRDDNQGDAKDESQ